MSRVKASKSIHNGGSFHGNLTRNHLIVGNNIELSKEDQGIVIIGLGGAIPRPSEEMANEQKSLLRLLPNPLKRMENGHHAQSFVDVYSGLWYSPPADRPCPAKCCNTNL